MENGKALVSPFITVKNNTERKKCLHCKENKSKNK